MRETSESTVWTQGGMKPPGADFLQKFLLFSRLKVTGSPADCTVRA